MPPRISIVIPMYNAQQWIGESLRSTIDQSYPRERMEIIVVDDGSTDESVAIADHVLHDGALHGTLVRAGGHRGAACARNIGWKIASGDWIQFLDADDLIAPTKLELQSRFAANVPDDVAVVTSKWQRLHYRRCEWHRASIIDIPQLHLEVVFDVLLHSDLGYLGPKLVRKTFLERIGGFDETMVAAEDLDLTLRLAMSGGKVREAPSAHPLYFYRVAVPNSLSQSCPPRVGAEMIVHIGKKVERYLLDNYAGAIPVEAFRSYRAFYSWALTVLFEQDYTRFRHVLRGIRELDPKFTPASAKKRIVAKLIGYENSERLGLAYRRTKEWAAAVFTFCTGTPNGGRFL